MIRAINNALFYIFLITLVGCASSSLETIREEPLSSDAGPVWPPPPQIARIQFIRSFTGQSDVSIKKSWFKKTMDSMLGKDETSGSLLRPYGVFADAGRIYVTDPGTRLLHVFDMKENKYLEIGKSDKREFMSPIGVAVDNNGEIYLTDSLLKRIFIFDKNGKYLREIGSDDSFARPAGMAIDGEKLYVVDTHGHKVVVFSKADGSFLFSFGKNGSDQGEFNYPTNICTDGKGQLYITDAMNFRVQIFDNHGHFISTFGKHGDGSGDFSKPRGVAVDSDGHIYVADALFDTVQIFDKDGKLLLAFGNTGREKGKMILPAGLFIDEEDKIYVADSYNNRVQIFQYVKEKDSSGQGAKESSGK